jgi:hypothetical protein
MDRASVRRRIMQTAHDRVSRVSRSDGRPCVVRMVTGHVRWQPGPFACTDRRGVITLGDSSEEVSGWRSDETRSNSEASNRHETRGLPAVERSSGRLPVSFGRISARPTRKRSTRYCTSAGRCIRRLEGDLAMSSSSSLERQDPRTCELRHEGPVTSSRVSHHDLSDHHRMLVELRRARSITVCRADD